MLTLAGAWILGSLLFPAAAVFGDFRPFVEISALIAFFVIAAIAMLREPRRDLTKP